MRSWTISNTYSRHRVVAAMLTTKQRTAATSTCSSLDLQIWTIKITSTITCIRSRTYCDQVRFCDAYRASLLELRTFGNWTTSNKASRRGRRHVFLKQRKAAFSTCFSVGPQHGTLDNTDYIKHQYHSRSLKSAVIPLARRLCSINW